MNRELNAQSAHAREPAGREGAAFGPMKQVAWSAALSVLAQRFGERCAVSDARQQRLSYRALDAGARALAGRLRASGIAAGTPVGVLLPNGLDVVVVSYGIRVSGAAEVPLSFGSTREELEWYARIAGFETVIAPPERHEQLRELGLSPRTPASLTTLEGLSTADRAETLPAVPADAACRILFTSGTTGRPKGMVYDHARRWIGAQLLAASLPFVPSPDARLVLMTPFSHGASQMTYAWCAYGAEVVLLDGVDPVRVDALLREGGVEAIFAPPTVLAKLAGTLGDTHYPGVRCVFTGTQPLTPALYRKAVAMFGPVVRITYGKTECTNPITVLAPPDADAWFAGADEPVGACVGWPAPGVEIRIEPLADDPAAPGDDADDDADGSAADDADAGAQPGSARHGEVLLRALHQSNGVIGPDGFSSHGPDEWHRTGDLGHVDARGRLVLTGRIADVIKTGGYRVNPDEIETTLAGLGRCAQVCVTSIPSDYWGEIIVAVAEQARDGWIDEARARVDKLSRHKRPRAFVAFDALPRNAQGKLSRRIVARLVLQHHALKDGPYPELEPIA